MKDAVIAKSFKKCGISYDIDENEDYMVFRHSDSEDDDDFEGFDNEDVTECQAAVEVADLLRPVPAVILWAIAYDKPGSSQESDFGHDTDPNSPGCWALSWKR